MSFSKGWILIYPFIITHRLIHDFMRESCQHLIQSLVKSLGKNVFPDMSYWVPMTESRWLYVGLVQLEPSFTMCLWNFLPHQE